MKKYTEKEVILDWTAEICRRLLDLVDCDTREDLQQLIDKPKNYTQLLYQLGVYHCLKEIDSAISSMNVKENKL